MKVGFFNVVTLTPSNNARQRRRSLAIAPAAVAAVLTLLMSLFALAPQAAAFEPEAIQLDCSGYVGAPGVIDIGAGDLPTAGSDIILGTPGDDVIAAGGGDDLICGEGGNDTIWGQDGDDVIIGGPGDDKLRGGDGNDAIFGGEGADDINGGRDNDTILGQGGDDPSLRGGTGDDYVVGGDGNEARISGNGGKDFLAGGAGNEALISGGPRPDELHGGAGNDLLKGLGGADRIFGDAGDDELRGGEQPDLVDGGTGTDLCNGGLKDDRGLNCETWETVEFSVPDPLNYTSMRSVECPLEPPAGAPPGITFTEPACTVVTVPEDDTDPANGRTIDLMVAYVDNGNPVGGAPIVSVPGGPGGSSLDGALFFGPDVNGFPYDILFMDPRGVGDSSPSLDCVEVDAVFEDLLGADPATAAGINAAAEAACAARLRGQGVNPGMFNSEQNADDLELVRRAMGFGPWTLWGTSYGSRLSLTTARDHPEGVRAIVIDAVFPPEVDAFGSIQPNYAEQLDRLADACAAVVDCASAFGDLNDLIAAALNGLNANPQTVPVTGFDGSTTEVFINGDIFLFDIIFNLMYAEFFIPEIPRWIALAAEGNVTEVAELIAPQFAPENFEFSEGMFLAVMCQDEAAILAFPAAPGPDCSQFASDADYTFDKTPVSGAVPALIMNGSFDPITPPKWAAQAAADLDNATLAEFTLAGHGVGGPCFVNLFEAFVQAPGSALDTSCADQGLPDFNTGDRSPFPALDRSASFESWGQANFQIPALRPTNVDAAEFLEALGAN